MAEEKETVFESAATRIVRGPTWMKMIEYPLRGYANHYGWEIEVVEDRVVKVAAFCHAWRVAPCRSMDDYVTVAMVDDADFAQRVLERIRAVKSPEDFDSLLSAIEMRQRGIEDEVRAKFGELVDRFVELAHASERRSAIEELLRDEAKLRELLEEFIEQYVEDE